MCGKGGLIGYRIRTAVSATFKIDVYVHVDHYLFDIFCAAEVSIMHLQICVLYHINVPVQHIWAILRY